jgi:beta-lactamase superfamily II metal-dependent hydrolase
VRAPIPLENVAPLSLYCARRRPAPQTQPHQRRTIERRQSPESGAHAPGLHAGTPDTITPPTATGGRAHASDNDGSLVLRITIGDRAILITADIEAPAEAWLVDHAANLSADVLLIPHHGSASSSTPTFLVAVHPAAAILSAGANNQFGHPHPEVIERYDPIPTFRTDHHGTVTITSDGTHLWIRTANEGDPAR